MVDTLRKLEKMAVTTREGGVLLDTVTTREGGVLPDVVTTREGGVLPDVVTLCVFQ
eukprot:COSAG05_NODE_21598_length_270_cov_1.812865_1_plen_56_part_00